MHCIQHSRFTKQDGWLLWDLSLSLSGNIAVTGYNKNTHRTSLDVYSPVRNSDSRDKPKIFYSKEFDKYESEGRWYAWRFVSFVNSYDDNRGLVAVTGLGDKLEVFDLNQDRILKSRKVTLVNHGAIRCLSVREREIFIGFARSNKITVCGVTDLNEIKPIILQGFQDGYWPFDMTAITDRIFTCISDGKDEGYRSPFIFDEKNGKILSELTKPTDTRWYTSSVTVCVLLGVVAVVWYDSYWLKDRPRHQIVFYSLFSANNSSFLIVEIESDVFRIRISDRGDRMVTMNYKTGEVKVYDMAGVFTYSHLREKLASTLQTDDCTNLAYFFKIPKDQTDVILSSDKPSENLLLALEEKGVLQPYNVDRLIEGFAETGSDPFCRHVAEIYHKTRAQSTLYGRFLATLSAHLTASLPADLCDYFHVSDDKKVSITSSQNPGLSLLLALDEMGVIKVSEVGALEQPFTGMQMVQAVAKVHEYQSTVEEAESVFQAKDELTGEEKKDLFIQCLQKKIKSWNETMTPVPWKKSCRWRSTDLFIGCSLILTDTRPETTLASSDADIKIQYTEIFSHEKLKSEIRIILEGDPGSGKTMLMSQLAYDWCQGKFSEIGILILLPLKFVEQKTTVQAIKDFYFPEDDRLSVNDIDHFLSSSNISKCFLLDGLEEYNGTVTKGEQSEVTKIMSKGKYPTCTVVISSRSDYAQNLPKCPRLKLAKFSDTERNSYIQKVFPNNPKAQKEVKNVIKENPFILDLCSTPLLFVLVVHNIERMVKSRTGRLDRVAPFVNDMVDSICSEGMLKKKMEKLSLYEKSKKGTTLEELAYNGLCRGHQQLYWQKDFIESVISDSKEWVDAGVLVVEEGIGPASMVEREQDLSEITDAKSKDLNVAEQESKPAALGSGAVTKPLSGAYAESKSPLTLSTGSDSKDSEVTTAAGGSKSQSETTFSSGSTAKHFPLQVRFLHKIIQEWFAANHFASTMSGFRDESLLEKYVKEQLALIDPSDLHFVLRFTVAIFPPCCHLIMKYLLRSYSSEEGSIPQYIIDCIFLCFAEYDGEAKRNILEAVAEICRKDMTFLPENSRLLQQAKVRMVELASIYGILTRKLLLSDVVESASDDALEFTCGIMMEVSDTVEMFEIVDRNGILVEEDCTNIFKFIASCPLIKEAWLNFPNQPPAVDEETVARLQEDEKSVTWKTGSHKTWTLDTINGEWKIGSHISTTTMADRDKGSEWDGEQVLQTEGTVTTEGGLIEIPNTGVKLEIPPDALPKGMNQCTICMKIIQPDSSDKDVPAFSINSSVIVELLPDKLTFQRLVKLSLPHCFQLKKDMEYKATIFMSHHTQGNKPYWEETISQPHELTDTTCVISLDSFCWVQYYVDGRVVEGKRLQVYTAGKHLSLSDHSYEAEVGYYTDVPGGGEKLRSNKRLVVASKQKLVYFREGEVPLKFLLQKIVPSESWKHFPGEQNPKEIAFETIARDEEKSCYFVFRKDADRPIMPIFIFRALQGDRGRRLLNRPKIWVPEGENVPKF